MRENSVNNSICMMHLDSTVCQILLCETMVHCSTRYAGAAIVLLSIKSIQQRPTPASLMLFTTNINTFTLAIQKLTAQNTVIYASNIKPAIEELSDTRAATSQEP